MIYTPKLNEIQNKIQNLLEKLEINSQFEKAKLIRDLVCRLHTIFESRRINTETLYNILYIIIQLAQSPLITTIDVDVLREKFEERYMRVEANKIIKNKKFNPEDLNFKRTVQFEPVDYNEESVEFSEDSDEELKEKCEDYLKFNSNYLEDDNQKAQRNIYGTSTMNTNINENSKINIDNYLVKINKNLFYPSSTNTKILNNIFNKNNPVLLEHLMKIHSRYDRESQEALTKIYLNLFNNKSEYKNCVSLQNIQKISMEGKGSVPIIWNPSNLYGDKTKIDAPHFNSNLEMNIDKNIVSSDFLLSIILVNLTYFDYSSIEDKFHFMNKFQPYICLDIEDQLFQNILSEINSFWNSLNFLRQFDLILERHEIKSVTIERFSFIIKEFLNLHDKILQSFSLLLNHQNGKLLSTNENEIFIKDASEFNLNFVIDLILISNNFIKEKLQNRLKFSLTNFFFFYSNHIYGILDYFINICKNTILIKSNLKKLNKSSNCLFVKDFIDMIYNYSKSKLILTNKNLFKINFEVFFNLIAVYLQIIYEFAINGNLIDTYNEFFIDHLITKKENSKVIYNFNEKFQKFNWIESLKIKSFKFNKIEGASVPQFLMINNVHFKILETCKSTFLLKNLKNSEKNKNSDSENESPHSIFTDDNLGLWKINQSFYDYLKEQIELFYKIEKFMSDEHNMVTRPENEYKANTIDLNRINQNLEENKNINQKMLTDFPFKAYNPENNFEIKLVDNYHSLNYIDEIFYERDEDSVKNVNNFDGENSKLMSNKSNLNLAGHLNESQVKHVYVNPLQNINYRSYYFTHDGKIEEMKEIEALQQIINSEEERFLKKKKISDNIQSSFLTFDLEHIIKNLIISRILSINQMVNKKLLSYLFDVEKLSDHFNVIFNFFLFRSGFSMNKFTMELNSYINSGVNFNNFFLMNLLNEISHNSDLISSRDKILKYVSINFKDANSAYLNFQDSFVVVEYQPKLPINIFFDNSINEGYNIIFNYLLRVKRASSMIKNAE